MMSWTSSRLRRAGMASEGASVWDEGSGCDVRSGLEEATSISSVVDAMLSSLSKEYK